MRAGACVTCRHFDCTSTTLESTEAPDARSVVQDALKRKLAAKQAAGDEEAVRVIQELESAIDPDADADGFNISLLDGGPPWM
ncbi:MAG: hypothetical protein ACI8RN_000090 [Glaciecola sp.]|jgi:hypothetical protein